MRELFRQLKERMEAGERTVLVTIVASSGSTPRGAGARMLVGRTGRLCGTIGGGRVEFEAEQRAKAYLQSEISDLEHYRLYANEIADLGMICGGETDAHFRTVGPDEKDIYEMLFKIEEQFAEHRSTWIAYDLSEKTKCAIAIYNDACGVCGMALPDEIFRSRPQGSCKVLSDGKEYYVEKLITGERVYIFGGGHVSQALVPALNAVGFTCVVLEDRAEFAKDELFGNLAETMLIDMDHISEAVSVSADDYVCVMTRGHQNDLNVQAQILKTPAKYIGVIGSRKKTKAVNKKLQEMGYTERDTARIISPIGLDLGGETPAEIAVSITAQLIMVRAGRTI
jgi:xanthine dehydrogenase accessory factor